MYTPTRAIVLRGIRYSEADLIAKCYTASHGKVSYILKGVLKTRKGKIKAAMFQPFSQLEIISRHKGKGTLEYIKEAKITAINPSIRENVQKSSMAILLSEVLQSAIQEEEQNEALYTFLESSIELLEKQPHFANFHLYFLVKLTRYLGIEPDVHSADNTSYFNVRKGHFEKQGTDQYAIGGSNCFLLKSLLTMAPRDLPKLKLNQEKRQSFLLFILSYYQYQLPGFRQPKSLEVLTQLFV